MAAVLAGLAVAGTLAAMSEEPGWPANPDFGSPTKLDYLVLASIADAPHLLTVSAYHSTAERRATAQIDARNPQAAGTPSQTHSD